VVSVHDGSLNWRRLDLGHMGRLQIGAARLGPKFSLNIDAFFKENALE
jgi:hypothetical protein